MQDIHIGSLPPIQNGISVYLYRLSRIEKRAKFIDWNQIMEPKRFRTWLIKQLFSFKKKNFIFHPHSLKKRLWLYFLSCISFHEFSLVIHGFPLVVQYNESNVFKKFFILRMLNKARFIQVVNPIYKKFLNRLKVKNENIIVKNAFLPPPLDEEDKIVNTYENKLINFLENRTPIIVSNAPHIYFVNNIDVYGIDMCIELINLLKSDFPKIGLLFALADNETFQSYYQKMKERIRNYNIEENFYFITGNKELWPIFKKADLMMRPTILEGDSTSVREALYFKCPVIASDVTSRPQGTILFKNRDIKDLYEHCRILLKNNLEKVNEFES